MIVYGGGILGFTVLLRVHGSAAYKAIVPALCSTGILLAFEYGTDHLTSEENSRWFGHPYPLASLIVAFTFLLTFKCSYSYNRYWEACSAVHQMHSRWVDVGMMLASFHYQSCHFDDMKPRTYASLPGTTRIIRKRERENQMSASNKMKVILGEPVTINRNGKKRSGATNSRPGLNRIKSVAKMDGGVDELPSLFLQESAHLLSILSAVAFSTLRVDIEGVETPIDEWIPGSPFPPVDPDHKDARIEGDFYEMSSMRKALFFLLGLSRTPAKRTIYNAYRPFKVLGGVSDAEIEILKTAHGPSAKTSLCSMWLQEFITREYLDGSLGNVAPPILSRIYQCVSEGMMGYTRARQIAYVPFPFPHNQLTAFFTFVMMVILPILMLSYVHSVVLAAILNALVIAVFVGLYEVGRELESPFRNVPNDLPLNNFQGQFNETLITMFAGYHPDAWWELDETSQ